MVSALEIDVHTLIKKAVMQTSLEQNVQYRFLQFVHLSCASRSLRSQARARKQALQVITCSYQGETLLGMLSKYALPGLEGWLTGLAGWLAGRPAGCLAVEGNAQAGSSNQVSICVCVPNGLTYTVFCPPATSSSLHRRL